MDGTDGLTSAASADFCPLDSVADMIDQDEDMITKLLD